MSDLFHKEIRKCLEDAKHVNRDLRELNREAGSLRSKAPYERHNRISKLSFFINNGYIEGPAAKKLIDVFSSLDDESFYELMLHISTDKRYASSIDELKKGFEEGLSINELKLITGKTSKDTHDKKLIYSRYMDFFRSRTAAGYGSYIMAYLNMRLHFENIIPEELILKAESIEDLEIKAPVVKVSERTYFQIESRCMHPDCAYYVELWKRDKDGENEKKYFHCVSPDGDSFDSVSEADAAAWVSQQNDRKYSRTKVQKQKLQKKKNSIVK